MKIHSNFFFFSFIIPLQNEVMLIFYALQTLRTCTKLHFGERDITFPNLVGDIYAALSIS